MLHSTQCDLREGAIARIDLTGRTTGRLTVLGLDFVKSVKGGTVPHGMSIEREDNQRGYSPSNCQWATSKTQGRNKRNNRLVEINGQTKCMSEWAELSGISVSLLFSRLKAGWASEDAVFRPNMIRFKAGSAEKC